MTGIPFSICCLMFLVILAIFYFSKKRLDTIDNKLFTILMIINIVGIFIDIFGFVSFSILGKDNLFNFLVSKIYLIYFLAYVFILFLYVYNISTQNLKNRVKKYTAMFFAVSFVISLCPISIYFDNNIGYTSGLSVSITYLIGILMIITMLYYLIKNVRIIGYKKYTPLFAFVVLLILVVVIQNIKPALTLMLFANTVVTYLMYFTIENPDLKLLEETHKAKEISDNANEEKTLFLYNMTQEIRNITNKIDDDADVILDSKDLEVTYDSARDIKANTSKFINMTNDILDVSNIDASTIKIYNSKYNIKNILKQVINVYSNLCKDKELKFITNIDHDIPEVLYGDSIGLKEVLNTVLNNSVKYTNKGFVELSVNTIIKNDICRLIITIEDSGIGIKSEDINKIKVDNKSLAKANKSITMMNGTMLISSDYGVGTKVKLILDQKIELEENSEVAKYDSVFDDINILCVDDSEAGLKIIDKLLKGTKVKIDKAETGKECLDKVRVNKYDIILLDEDLAQITGIELMGKIKEIRNFKTPVILLTKDNSYEYNEEYFKVGFSDYLLKPIKKELLLEKIDKYMKKDKK